LYIAAVKNIIMQKRFFAPFILLLVVCGAYSCRGLAELPPPSQEYIVIMHPTTANINTWQYLVSEGILPVDPGMPVVGVYSNHASYDYTQAAEFIKTVGKSHIRLVGIEQELSPADLFRENAATPAFRKIFERARAVIFFGGPDIPPAVYGRDMNLLTVVTDPHRHYLELSFLFHLTGGYQDDGFAPFMDEKPGLPVLGICLGMQTMNVAAGGTLIQDIPTEIYGKTTVEQVLDMDQDQLHRNYYSAYRTSPGVAARAFHRIRIQEGSHMHSIAGTNISPYILSSHHQALDDIGNGYRVTAWCMDGRVAEAIEHETYPNVIGIQFHPEVSSLFIKKSKIQFSPVTEATHSFIDLYPEELGENFHREFWRYFGGLIFNPPTAPLKQIHRSGRP
jgi:putative glutamine amidotransferase